MIRSRFTVSLAWLLILMGSWSWGYAQSTDSNSEEVASEPEFNLLDELTIRMKSGIRPEREASPVLLAGNQLRRIIIELAARGHGDGETAAIAALASIRLSDSLSGLTRRLETLSRPVVRSGVTAPIFTEEDRVRTLERLRTFHRTALDELRRRPCTDAAQLDRTLSLILAPVRDGIEIIEGRHLASHWPVGRETTPVSIRRGSSTDEPIPTPPPGNKRERLRSVSSIDRSDLERVERLSNAAREVDDPGIAGLLLRHQFEITDLMIRAEGIDVSGLNRRIQSAARRIEVHRRRSMKDAIDDLGRLASTPQSVVDPLLIERLAEVATRTRDLERLNGIDDLTDRLIAMLPSAERRLANQMARWSQALAEDRTRKETAAILDRITSDLARLRKLPAESILSEADGRTDDLVAGRAADLLLRIDETRRLWVDEVSNGVADGPSRRQLLDLDRLCLMLLEVDALGLEGQSASKRIEVCNRWGGWYVSGDSIGRVARTIVPGLRLAAASAADGDFERLGRDLRRLEEQAPPVRLITWIFSNVEAGLQSTEGGSAGALAAISIPPGPKAWGIGHRESIARICVMFAESSSARRRGDPNAAQRISSRMVMACEEVLRNVSSLPAESAVGPSNTPEMIP